MAVWCSRGRTVDRRVKLDVRKKRPAELLGEPVLVRSTGPALSPAEQMVNLRRAQCEHDVASSPDRETLPKGSVPVE